MGDLPEGWEWSRGHPEQAPRPARSPPRNEQSRGPAQLRAARGRRPAGSTCRPRATGAAPWRPRQWPPGSALA